MGTALLLALLAAAPGSYVFPGGGGSGGMCTLDGSQSGVATSYRATTATGTAFQTDSVLDCSFDTGPGSRNCIGTNVSGEILFGPGSGNTTVGRLFGDLNVIQLIGSNVTANTALIFGASAFLVNSTGAKPVLVDDADGLQVKCKTAITTCASAIENSEIPVCGTGGALTKRCVCMGDGTTYAWRNLFNLAAGAGTTTTCPAT